MAAPVVGKTKTANAGRYSYKYASLADTIKTVDEAYGYLIEQTIQHDEQGGREVVTRYKPKEDGEWSDWLAPVPILSGSSQASNPMQQLGAAISYARRYSLQCALCMAADDTDGLPQQQARQPQPCTPQQAQSINAMFKTLGVGDQQTAHAMYLTALCGPIGKASDLTDVQAEQVMAYLNKQIQQQAQQRADEHKEQQQ